MRYTPVLLAAVLGLSSVAGVATAFAQQSTAPLPPALRAAVASGNTNMITTAIKTLSAGNPIQAANLANQVLMEAERLLSTNPQAALNAASAAMAVTNNLPVTTSSPQVAMENAVIAARIVSNPAVIAVNPSAANTVAVDVVAVVSQPSVYAVSPNAAIAAMAKAYVTASSPAVLAVVPSAQENMAQTLTTIAKNTSLSAASPDTPSDIAAILAKTDGVVSATPQNQQQVNQSPAPVTTQATDITAITTSPSRPL
jgi:hypothetical protein